MSHLYLFDPDSGRKQAVDAPSFVIDGRPEDLERATDFAALRSAVVSDVLNRWLSQQGVKSVYGPDSSDARRLPVGEVEVLGPALGARLGARITPEQVRLRYHGEVLRAYLLAAPYRAPMCFEAQVRCPACQTLLSAEEQDTLLCGTCDTDCTEQGLFEALQYPGLDEADRRVSYVYDTIGAAQRKLEQLGAGDVGIEATAPVAGMLAAFTAQLNDDLKTGGAIQVLSEALKETNRWVQSGKGIDPKVRRQTLALCLTSLERVSAALGLFGMDPSKFLVERRLLRATLLGLDPSHIAALVFDREQARQAKDYQRADAARQALDALGVRLIDGPQGSIWSL